MDYLFNAFSRLWLHLKNHKYFYFVLLAVSAVYIVPMLFIELPLGHDIYFHMDRIEGISEEIAAGNIPARIYTNGYYGLGYAAPLFYGDWFLYIPALAVLAGVKLVTAYKGFIMLCAVCAALSMYFSGKIIFGDKRAAALAAFAYSLSSYMATDAIIRHANGELQAFIFLPIAFAGLYNIIRGECKYWVLLPLGLCGMLASHTLSAFMAVIAFVLYSLTQAVYLLRRPRKFLYILAGAGMFFLFAASLVFPMLEQINSGEFYSTNGVSATAYGTLSFRSVPDILRLFSMDNAIKPFIPKGTGLVLPLLAIWHAVRYKKASSVNSFTFAGFSLLFLFMISKHFPWDTFQDIAGILQFPWRIYLFAVFFIALYGGEIAKKLRPGKSVPILVAAVLLLSAAASASTLWGHYSNAYKLKAEGTEREYPYNNHIGYGEALPSEFNRSNLSSIINNPLKIRYSALLGDIEYEKADGVTTVSGINGNLSEDTYIDFPLIMYKGYSAVWISDETGEESALPVSYGFNDLVRVTIGSNNNGSVKVWYEGTDIQKLSSWVSFLALSGTLVCFIYLKARKKTKPGVLDIAAPAAEAAEARGPEDAGHPREPESPPAKS